ncbi:MAG: cytochrome C, partial [Chitinophagaceae bacterium]|nr:cytochrome C [Chitinophagaceae bacterium]
MRRKQTILTVVLVVIITIIFVLFREDTKQPVPTPELSTIYSSPDRDLILYGRALISTTSFYLGPNGTVAKTTNGMNCQNCHLDAGTRPFGNNYSAVKSMYPLFRARSGGIETI